MSSVLYLKDFISKRLTAAAEEIFLEFEKTIVQYEEQLDRQRRLLDVGWKPPAQLQAAGFVEQISPKKEVFLTDDQVKKISSIKQEQGDVYRGQAGGQAPLKQEADVSLVMVSHNETEWNSQQLLAHGSPLPQSQEFSENRQVLPEHGPAFQAPSSHGDRVIISGDQLPVEPSTEYQFPLLKKPYTCSTCEKVFQYASTLRSHLRSHLVEKPYACKTCGKKFSCRFNLKVHIRIHTGERPYSCKTCGKAFTNKAHLRYHAGVHTVRTQILEPEQKLFSCDTCGKKYTCRASLVIHMRTHTGEKPFSCETCGKNFTCSSNLKVHMRIHTGEKPYSCQTCGRAFSNQGHLRYHTKIHTGKAQNPVKKLHSCETCGKTYTSRASLVIHVRTHTGEKPFSCKMCGKRFSRSANCKIHMRIHTGEKPYCCKICEKCFTNKAHLRSHMKGHMG
ncbi:zinc finger protein 664-like [Oryzias latipes]|uniref:zinc finger protein 664-like n=1 Tax=Oryzias latipes TaxID=8090 RepID=UPI000CE24246|nr:zinc finger protein 664-like [Oryzias latipes]